MEFLSGNMYSISYSLPVINVHVVSENILQSIISFCRSEWPRGQRRKSAAVRLLRLWVRIPPGAWMFLCCECCVLSGRGLCDGDSYQVRCVVVCALNLVNVEAPGPLMAVAQKTNKQTNKKQKKNKKV